MFDAKHDALSVDVADFELAQPMPPQAESLFQIRQVLADIATLQKMPSKEFAAKAGFVDEL